MRFNGLLDSNAQQPPLLLNGATSLSTADISSMHDNGVEAKLSRGTHSNGSLAGALARWLISLAFVGGLYSAAVYMAAGRGG